MVHFRDVEPFLKKNEDLPPTTRTKLQPSYSYSLRRTRRNKLQVKLASVIDYGNEFVTTTYKLE